VRDDEYITFEKTGKAFRVAVVAAVLVSIMVTDPSWASGQQTPLDDDLTGEWGGVRSYLRSAGVYFNIEYTSDTASNVKGGPDRHTEYADQIKFRLMLDLDRLLSIPNATFKATITDRNGNSLSSPQQLDTLELVQESYGRGETWILTEFWYGQTFLDQAFDWKFGRMSIGDEFAYFPCNFMNVTFCGAAPGSFVSNWYDPPIGQLGTRVRLAIDGFGYLETGGYEINPNYLIQRYAFTLGNVPGATGAMIPIEVGWLPKMAGGQLQGSYKVGGWYDTSHAQDVVENSQGLPLLLDGGKPLSRVGRYGTYVTLQQQLTHAPGVSEKQGLGGFFNATFTDRRTATIDNQIAAGLVYTGMFASRPLDDIEVAIGRTHVNPRVTQVEILQNEARLGPVGVQTSEYESEVDYSLHATRWLILRPNLQYIHQPGGISQRTDDIVVGLKVVASL
jgi:porin